MLDCEAATTSFAHLAGVFHHDQCSAVIVVLRLRQILSTAREEQTSFSLTLHSDDPLIGPTSLLLLWPRLDGRDLTIL